MENLRTQEEQELSGQLEEDDEGAPLDHLKAAYSEGERDVQIDSGNASGAASSLSEDFDAWSMHGTSAVNW